jgi:hypothetical protein
MLEDPPATMPYLMPMTAAVAPTFAERYPEAAIVFDNLHMMHDVVSDILTSPLVPRNRKRPEILRAAALFRDGTSYLTSVDEWRMMGTMMGVENMGGPAVGFLDALPAPTVPRGMSMAGMDHGAMAGVQRDTAGAAGHVHVQQDTTPAAGDADAKALELLVRLLADPQVEARVHADPALHRLWSDAAVQAALRRLRERIRRPNR